MARQTFEERVEGLTGLTFTGSSSPNETELTQFLRDGVADVKHRLLAIKPELADNFLVIMDNLETSYPNYWSEDGEEIVEEIEVWINKYDGWRHTPGSEVSLTTDPQVNEQLKIPATRVSMGEFNSLTSRSNIDYSDVAHPIYTKLPRGGFAVHPIGHGITYGLSF